MSKRSGGIIGCKFSYFCFLNEAAALRLIVLRYACAPTDTCGYLTTVYVLYCMLFIFCFLGEVAFFPSTVFYYLDLSSL